MENIEKCLKIALSELGKIGFSGNTVIPAGRAMDALLLASQEVQQIKAEKMKKDVEERKDNEREGADG